MGAGMRSSILTVLLCISALPALADPGGIPNGGVGNGNGNGNEKHILGAPAPLLGAGIPAALILGGVLLGAKLIRRKR